MLVKSEKVQLRQLLQTPQWSSLDHLYKDMIEKYKGEFGARDSEWETLRVTLLNEGKIRGLTEFMQEIYQQIQSND